MCLSNCILLTNTKQNLILLFEAGVLILKILIAEADVALQTVFHLALLSPAKTAHTSIHVCSFLTVDAAADKCVQ